MLRVERESTGELGSVPFVWKEPGPRPGSGRTIDSLAKVAPANLLLIKGSRIKTPLSNGRVQDTFSVFGNRGNKNTQTDYSRLKQFFELAGTWSQNENYTDFIYLVDQVNDEIAPRKSVIYSGTIVPVDDAVVDQGMESDHAIFTVTVERDSAGEFGETIASKPLGKVVSSHGGVFVLPSTFASNGTKSRAANIMVRDAGNYDDQKPGYIKKLWLGIKPNETGFSTLDPTIKFGFPSYTLLEGDNDAFYRIDLRETAIDDHYIAVTFETKPNWTVRTRSPIKRWNDYIIDNTDVLTNVNRALHHYAGMYHLVGRYRIEGDSDAVVGFCVGAGWENINSVNWNTKYFLRPALNSQNEKQWQYKNFGTINIGGGLWGMDVQNRLVLDNFSIFTQSQLAQGDSDVEFHMDNMELVPANHYLYLELDKRIGPRNRIEVFQNIIGKVHAYVAESRQKDRPGFPLQGLRNVYSGISNITEENWAVPWEEKSLLVAVADDDQFNSKNSRSQLRLDMAIKHRTEGYTYDD
ncbi:MAG: hypothetical protein GWO23_10095 [Gammaproteobacteria bacterium]|nr:hypothetical protein [Gammaproteobacteria bacterium]